LGDRAVVAPEGDTFESPLVQPLAAAAARRGGDPDRVEVPRTHAFARRLRDRSALCAHAERIRGVLDVAAVEEAPVLRQRERADEIVRVGRVRARGRGLRAEDELFGGHESTWKTTSVMSAPSAPP